MVLVFNNGECTVVNNYTCNNNYYYYDQDNISGAIIMAQSHCESSPGPVHWAHSMGP